MAALMMSVWWYGCDVGSSDGNDGGSSSAAGSGALVYGAPESHSSSSSSSSSSFSSSSSSSILDLFSFPLSPPLGSLFFFLPLATARNPGVGFAGPGKYASDKSDPPAVESLSAAITRGFRDETVSFRRTCRFYRARVFVPLVVGIPVSTLSPITTGGKMPRRFFDRLIRRVSDVIKTLIVPWPVLAKLVFVKLHLGGGRREESVEPGCEIAFIAEG